MWACRLVLIAVSYRRSNISSSLLLCYQSHVLPLAQGSLEWCPFGTRSGNRGRCWVTPWCSGIGCWDYSTTRMLSDMVYSPTRYSVTKRHNGWTSILSNTPRCSSDSELGAHSQLGLKTRVMVEHGDVLVVWLVVPQACYQTRPILPQGLSQSRYKMSGPESTQTRHSYHVSGVHIPSWWAEYSIIARQLWDKVGWVIDLALLKDYCQTWITPHKASYNYETHGYMESPSTINFSPMRRSNIPS